MSDSDLLERARMALGQIRDPEAGLSVIDLGLIYELTAEDGRVRVTMTFTSEGCPASGFLVDEIEAALRGLDGVDDATVTVTFEPPWTPDRITPDGRAMLGW